MDSLQVFIVGSPRSGTSVLYHAMRKVFHLPGRGESHVLPIFQRMMHEYYLYLESFKSEKTLVSLMDMKEFRHHMYLYIDQFYKRVYPHGSWVDKTPGAEAIQGASIISAVFPSACVILTRRTGIEVVQSYRGKFKADFDDACRSWARCMAAAANLRKTSIEILEIDQFDIANHPELVSKKLALYLRSPESEDELAKFFQSHREDRLSTHDWSRRLTLAGTEWTDPEKQTFLEICGEEMKQLGYPL